MKLLSMQAGETVKDVLDRAQSFVEKNECDEIVIVIQPKKGWSRWFGRDSSRVETMLFLLQGAVFHFNLMLFGLAPKKGTDGR
jgi:hypothetical protein